MSKQIRTRYAPSPTGFSHIGGLRTALFSFLLAHSKGGKFILRIEDTDQARLIDGALEDIVKTFSEFKIEADEGPFWEDGKINERGDKGPYVQSKRLDLYNKHSQELIEKQAAYYCFCSSDRLQQLRESQEAQKLAPKYDKLCLKLSPEEIKAKLDAKEPHVIRLNVPLDKTIKFTDLVRGEIEIASKDVDDQVLVKSDGFPTYHLAVVVDDHYMEISHVLRGEEWISSTPKHLLLYESFGWEPPLFGHLPNILGKAGKKLSKRESDVAVKDFVAKGYLREAILNFIVLLGWNPKTEQEIFSLDELIKIFDVSKINKSGAVFDLEKLDWINGLYLRKMDPIDLVKLLLPFLKEAGFDTKSASDEFLVKIVKLEQDRLKKLSEIGERVTFFFNEPQYEASLLIWKKTEKETIKTNLGLIKNFLTLVPESGFLKETLEAKIKAFIADNKLNTGEVLWPLRVSLSGVDASPGPFELMDAFGVLSNGKEIILQRIDTAIAKLA